MKRFIFILLGIFLVFFIIIITFLAYMGLFSSPKASEKNIGPYTFIYEEFIGPYKDTGPVFDKIYKALEKHGIKTTLGIGIYFDDPKNVPQDKLRSQCGVIINEKDLSKVEEQGKSYKIGHIERGKSIVVEFPIKNSLSYMIGPMKGYPALTKYIEGKNYTIKNYAFEIYDIPSKKILFVWQL